MKLCMIMAMDKNRLIGAQGGLPWHLPAELQYFKQVTMGKPLIMGRKTHDSIGRPLPGRTNIVVTRQSDWTKTGIYVASDLERAIELAQHHLDTSREVMIIGGASLCREAMPRVEKLYLTEIDHVFEGDVWLDSYNPEHWREISSRTVAAGDGQAYAYTCRVLERIIINKL